MSRRWTRIASTALAGAVAAAAVTGCSAGAPVAAVPAGGEPPVDPGMEHVHGLGVDPADGALLAVLVVLCLAAGLTAELSGRRGPLEAVMARLSRAGGERAVGGR